MKNKQDDLSAAVVVGKLTDKKTCRQEKLTVISIHFFLRRLKHYALVLKAGYFEATFRGFSWLVGFVEPCAETSPSGFNLYTKRGALR